MMYAFVCALLCCFTQTFAFERGTSESLFRKGEEQTRQKEKEDILKEAQKNREAVQKELNEARLRVEELGKKSQELSAEAGEVARRQIAEQLDAARKLVEQKEQLERQAQKTVSELQSQLTQLLEGGIKKARATAQTNFDRFVDGLYAKLQSIRTQIEQLFRNLFARGQKINEMKNAAQNLAQATKESAKEFVEQKQEQVAEKVATISKVVSDGAEQLQQVQNQIEKGAEFAGALRQKAVEAGSALLQEAIVLEQIVNTRKMPTAVKENLSAKYDDLFKIVEVGVATIDSLRKTAGIADTAIPRAMSEIERLKSEYQQNVSDLLNSARAQASAQINDEAIAAVLRNFDRLKQVDPAVSNQEFFYLLVKPIGEAQELLLAELAQMPLTSYRALELVDKWAALHERYREGVELLKLKTLVILPAESGIKGELTVKTVSYAQKSLQSALEAFRNAVSKNDQPQMESRYSDLKKIIDRLQNNIGAAPITRLSIELQSALMNAHQQVLDILQSRGQLPAIASQIAGNVLTDVVNLTQQAANDASQLVQVKSQIAPNENPLTVISSAVRKAPEVVQNEQFDFKAAMASKDELRSSLQLPLTTDQRTKIESQLTLKNSTDDQLTKIAQNTRRLPVERATAAFVSQNKKGGTQSFADVYAKSGFSGLANAIKQPQVASFSAVLSQGQRAGQATQLQFSGLPFLGKP